MSIKTRKEMRASFGMPKAIYPCFFLWPPYAIYKYYAAESNKFYTDKRSFP